MNTPHSPPSLSNTIEEVLEAYFAMLEEEEITNLHSLVVSQVEAPMIRFVLRKTNGNRTHAARILGINRNTLLRKITLYNIEL